MLLLTRTSLVYALWWKSEWKNSIDERLPIWPSFRSADSSSANMNDSVFHSDDPSSPWNQFWSAFPNLHLPTIEDDELWMKDTSSSSLIEEINQSTGSLTLSGRAKEWWENVFKRHQQDVDESSLEERDSEDKIDMPPNYEIRPDPRLVPSVIYDMECVPGLAFHSCIQDCTAAARRTNSSFGGSYEEAEGFKACVKNCTDALLNSPGPGCLTQDGRLIQRLPGQNTQPLSPGVIKMRAWIYRMTHSLSRPFGTYMSSMVFSGVILFMVLIMIYGLSHFKVHELIFIYLNGLPDGTTRARNEVEKRRWENAQDVHDVLRNRALQMEDIFVNFNHYFDIFLTSLVSALKTCSMGITSIFNAAAEYTRADNPSGSHPARSSLASWGMTSREEDYMQRLNQYDLTIM